MSGQEANSQSSGSAARPPQVIERGAKGVAQLVAIFAPATLYGAHLHSWVAEAMAMPDLVGHEHNYIWALNIGLFQIIAFARPVRARHWGQMAAVAVAYPTASILTWWSAAGLLFHLAPGYELGSFTGLLLVIMSYAFGFLAYFAIHRLAGAHSPWRVEEEPAAGGSDDRQSPAEETRA